MTKEVTTLETNHRVLEITMGDGKSMFYPQKKMLFLVWRPILNSNRLPIEPHQFSNLEAASEFLHDRQVKIKSETVVKKTKHPFNLVFQKLKQTNNE